MKCPECVEAGLRSTVRDQGGMVTLVGYHPYYDEDGLYHSHDPNTRTTIFVCSNKHSWIVKSKSPCPNCRYGK